MEPPVSGGLEQLEAQLVLVTQEMFEDLCAVAAVRGVEARGCTHRAAVLWRRPGSDEETAGRRRTNARTHAAKRDPRRSRLAVGK